MEKLQIENLIKDEFLSIGNFKKLKSYKIYERVIKIKEILENTLTFQQREQLFLLLDTYKEYNEEHLNEFSKYLSKALKSLYQKS